MKIEQMIPKWVWWKKGECVVEVLKMGHYPTSIIAKLPNDTESEIDIDELDLHNEKAKK
jgi:hypothetical protein